MQPRTLYFQTNNITGNRQLTGLPFIPKYIRLTVGQKHNTAEAFIHRSEGAFDGTSKFCHSTFWDASGGKVERFTDRVINHINRVGGVLTNQIVADSISYVDNGGGDYRMNINFTATVTGYRVDMELFP